jgi:hypothetical protein
VPIPDARKIRNIEGNVLPPPDLTRIAAGARYTGAMMKMTNL